MFCFWFSYGVICFWFGYESAPLSVLSIILIKGYMMNSEYQIFNLTSFETGMEWFSPSSSFSVLCPGICALLLWKRSVWGFVTISITLKKSRASSTFLGISKNS